MQTVAREEAKKEASASEGRRLRRMNPTSKMNDEHKGGQ